MNIRTILLWSFLLLGACLLPAQNLQLSVTPSLAIPVGASSEYFTVGGGTELSGAWALPPLPLLHVGGAVGYYALPTRAATLLSAVAFSAGGGVRWEPAPRLGLLLDARAGAYLGMYEGDSRLNFFASAAPGVDFQLSSSLRLGAGAEFIGLLARDNPLFTGLGVRLSGSWLPAARKDRAILNIEVPRLLPVFPIFFKHYDESPLGSVRIENRGRSTVSDLRVSFLVSEFMDSAKQCAEFAQLKRGEAVEAPLLALFSDRILSVTESTKVTGVIRVSYTLRDELFSQERTESIRILDRNALSWDDDRKAAAFISAKDPAVQRFAKEIAGGVREDPRPAGSLEFRVAMGMFQALAVYGMSYVVDPDSSYVSLSADSTAVDYVQFPRQTLQYRSGDCDDLAILFCALLESVGIETAFITVPGHIYAALALPLSPQELNQAFYDSSRRFLVQDGKVFLPVETTVFSKGFVAAWEEGLRQWAAAGSKAKLFPVREAWKSYESVGIREADPSLLYPDWKATQASYGSEHRKFVALELDPQLEQIRQQIQNLGSSPRLKNRLGVLYARYGMYSEAEKEWKAIVAASEYVPALINLGNVALLRDNPAAALGLYEKARRKEPKNTAALAGIVRSLQKQNKSAEAARTLDQLAQLDPDYAARLDASRGEPANSGRASAGGEQPLQPDWVE